MGHWTERAMREIGIMVKTVHDERALFYKVNWIIVRTSHKISDRRHHKGHLTRQKIRKRLWKDAKKRYEVLRKYILPHEITGDCSYRIRPISMWKKALDMVSIVLRKLGRLFK